MIWQLIAALCSGTFAGAAIYISAVEHPARLECGSLLALREFVPSYRRATVMQASLAAVGCLAAAAAWSTGRGSLCLLGAILLGSVIPFTLIVILPINQRLLDPSLDPQSREAAELLRRWGRLHAVRSVLGAASFLSLIVPVVTVPAMLLA
jgi:hypothetical protein